MDEALPFRSRNFKLWWLGALVSLVGTQMTYVAVRWQIFKLTEHSGHAASYLGWIGAARAIPMILMALVGGAIADAFDRRRLMLVTQSAFLALSGVLALASWQGWANLPVLYATIALQGAFLAVDLPARQSLVPNLVPRSALPRALSLQGTAFSVSMVAGPALGSFVIAWSGTTAVYVVDVASFVVLLVALFFIDYRRAADAPPVPVSMDAALEGFRFLWRTPVLWTTMVLDFAATFLAGCEELMPIFATSYLASPGTLDALFDAPEKRMGWLNAAPAAGSALCAFALSYLPPPRRQGLTVLLGCALFGVTTILFGLASSLLGALVWLALSGASDAASFVVRNTMRQELTPDSLRGRMTGVNMIFFVGGPLLGQWEAGVVADLWGPPDGARVSVVSGGVACVLVVLFYALTRPWLRGYVREPGATRP